MENLEVYLQLDRKNKMGRTIVSSQIKASKPMLGWVLTVSQVFVSFLFLGSRCSIDEFAFAHHPPQLLHNALLLNALGASNSKI